MNKRKSPPAETATLRRRAEERLRAKKAGAEAPLPEGDFQQLLHELQVHQIELEIQNAELRQARDEMESALERYTDLYDFAPVGYFTLDRHGIIHAVNLRGASLLGVPRTQLQGRDFSSFVTRTDRGRIAEFIRQVFAGPERASCELTLAAGTPSLFVQLAALACTSGQECRVAVVDITERRQLEATLKTLHAELAAHAADLETANIELEAFNYSVSHDLRRPLTVVNGYCQALQGLCADKLDERCQEYLREMYDGTLRMNRLIDTLLDFSHISRVGMRHEPVDLSQMAEKAARELRMSEPERQVRFRIAPGILAQGDKELLQLVLDNLLGNAWKFSANQEDTLIEFNRMEADGNPVCFVRDNGPGFDMAHADKLFVPFQRLPDTDVEGHGVGLSMVDRIVRRHGGRVWANGEPGRGATFYFTLDSLV